MDMINEWALIAIVIIAALGTIVGLLDSLGFLPPCITERINKNRVAKMALVLKEMGFNPPADSRSGSNLPSIRLEDRLSEAKIHRRVLVGNEEAAPFDCFIDLQGYITDSRNAKFFAREITTKLRRNKKILSPNGSESTIDLIACSKAGSPILAYELANLIEKPLMLYNEVNKFDSETDDIRANFDIALNIDNPKGKRVLIVDDSTTGGRKVMNIVKALQKREFTVVGCAVVFEPIGKGAREKLKRLGVELIAVTDGPEAVDG